MDPKDAARLARLEQQIENLTRKSKANNEKIAKLEQLLRTLGFNPDVVRS
jgi:hypothetical protein